MAASHWVDPYWTARPSNLTHAYHSTALATQWMQDRLTRLEGEHWRRKRKTSGVLVTAAFSDIPEYGKLSTTLMRQYARRHKYEFELLTLQRPDENSTSITANYVPWQKVGLLRYVLVHHPQTAFVAWLDLDVLLINFSLPIGDLLRLPPNQRGSSCHLAACTDVSLRWGNYFATLQKATPSIDLPVDAAVNTGIVVVRNSRKGRRALEAWDELRLREPELYKQFDPSWSHKPERDPYNGWPGEMGGMWKLLRDTLLPAGEACVPLPYVCDTLVSAAPFLRRQAVVARLAHELRVAAATSELLAAPEVARSVDSLPLALHLFGAGPQLRRRIAQVAVTWHQLSRPSGGAGTAQVEMPPSLSQGDLNAMQ